MMPGGEVEAVKTKTNLGNFISKIFGSQTKVKPADSKIVVE
jgi:hypothetical protein